MRYFIYMVAALAVLALGTVLAANANAIEKPQYTVITEDDKFEIRAYPALLIAEVTVTGDRKEAGNKAFKKLGGFIFGDNQARTKVAMTAPVMQTPAKASEPKAEKISMTAPVMQTRTAENSWVVSFMMPSEYTMDTLPIPDNADITIRETLPYKAVTIRFKGKWKTSTMEKRTKQLEAYAAEKGLVTYGPPDYAFYDPPFMPGFLRRNEVHLRLAE